MLGSKKKLRSKSIGIKDCKICSVNWTQNFKNILDWDRALTSQRRASPLLIQTGMNKIFHFSVYDSVLQTCFFTFSSRKKIENYHNFLSHNLWKNEREMKIFKLQNGSRAQENNNKIQWFRHFTTSSERKEKEGFLRRTKKKSGFIFIKNI
jgi:hypothetical protein